MTDAARPTFSDTVARAEQMHQVELWRAAQTVRSHVSQDQGRDALLELLGLVDVPRPQGM